MSEIKAIETYYKGYRFRSRLEARWAVFFDAAGIKYEYEPEGFDLDGVWYLPDFYLPWFKCYVEIKPNNSDEINDAEEKLWRLFRGKGDCCCMLCVGSPADNNMTVYCCETDDGGGGEGSFPARFLEGCWFLKDGMLCSGGKHFISLVLETRRERVFLDRNWTSVLPLDQSNELKEFRSDLEYEKMIARQARFEHGERG